MTSCLIFVNDAFICHAIYDWNRHEIGRLRDRMIAGGDCRIHFFNVRANHGAQAGIVLTTFFILSRALLCLW